MYICARDSLKRRDYIKHRYKMHKSEIHVCARGSPIWRLYKAYT